jgi:predicted  nucleic acid-binding Zn-ribbon protein
MEPLNPIKATGLEPVMCLDCGDVYAKPTRGGTLSMNPGCPRCGYVGWSLVKVRELSAERRRARFVADRQPVPLAKVG